MQLIKIFFFSEYKLKEFFINHHSKKFAVTKMSSRNIKILFCAIVALAICFGEISGNPVDSEIRVSICY